MSTIFEHIGFHIHCEDDVYRLADFVLNAGKLLPVQDGAYAVWSDASGSEVWSRVGLDHETKQTTLLNIDPHYSGKNLWKLKVGQALTGEYDDALDGKYVLYTEDEKVFVTARTMGVRALKEFHEGGVYYFQMSMIPHAVRLFESEDAYRAYYNDSETVPGVLFPRGMYSRMVQNAVEGEKTVREDILLTRLVAKIKSFQRREIRAEGEVLGRFCHMELETQLGPLDVPVSLQKAEGFSLEAAEDSGAYALVVGMLSGKVVMPPEVDQ